MAEQYVQLVSDAGNTGKKTRLIENTIGGNVVQQQVVSLADSAGNLLEGTTGQASAPVGVAANGLTAFKARDLAATVTAVKAAAGTLYSLVILNAHATIASYIQVFNLAAGSVVLGTTTPDLEFYVPALTTQVVNLGPVGFPFSAAIAVASTTLEKGSVGSAAGTQVFGAYK